MAKYAVLSFPSSSNKDFKVVSKHKSAAAARRARSRLQKKSHSSRRFIAFNTTKANFGPISAQRRVR